MGTKNVLLAKHKLMASDDHANIIVLPQIPRKELIYPFHFSPHFGLFQTLLLRKGLVFCY